MKDRQYDPARGGLMPGSFNFLPMDTAGFLMRINENKTDALLNFNYNYKPELFMKLS